MITAGIDIGSITAKAALIKDGRLLATFLQFTGYNAEKAGRAVLECVLEQTGIERNNVDFVVSTGYGRKSVDSADKDITEITCHGAGAHFINPETRFVIDVGGQDSKVIRIDASGKVLDFAMNDKCAAGTGRFLEVMARAMEADLDDFGKLSAKADNPAGISSICTVFAESEVISLISKGETRENMIAGIHESVASRISAMAGRVGVTEPVMMTGGVARNEGVVRALEKKLGVRIQVSGHAQLNGAIGAALLAARMKKVS
ncbi:MAG: 2-hydroxyglutaryl-CoA dehydratase [Desulfobacterales bacterium]|nr:2-hydroxyglutaryl-CoA dehydratase [Desulfobacterales bacterium]